MSETEMIPLDRLPERVPEWPLSPWMTGHLIRKKRLGCVRVGRRVYVTRESLSNFIKAEQDAIFAQMDISADEAVHVLIPKNRKSSHLYAIAGEVTGLVKIGRAGNVQKRLSDLQVGSPDRLQVPAWAFDAGHLEGLIHRGRCSLRVHGEWFSSDLALEIQGLGCISVECGPCPKFTAWAEGFSLIDFARQDDEDMRAWKASAGLGGGG